MPTTFYSDLHPSFQPGQQQDAHEFMINLVDRLLSHVSERYDGVNKAQGNNNKSIILTCSSSRDKCNTAVTNSGEVKIENLDTKSAHLQVSVHLAT